MPKAPTGGNGFHCSREHVFDPKLAGVPVIAPSNNDGLAIARTARDQGTRDLLEHRPEGWFPACQEKPMQHSN